MTGEELLLSYQDKGPEGYFQTLMSIYLAIGDKIFPLLTKAQKEDKILSVKPYSVDSVIRDVAESDIIFV